MGTRHRAALGLSEETDAVIIVVSEENGKISMCFGGKIKSEIDTTTLSKTLEKACLPKQKKTPFMDYLRKLDIRLIFKK